jgi:hypothetical protein
MLRTLMIRKTILILKGLALLGLVCGFNRMAFTQAPKQDRIASIAESSPVRLEGNRRPMFRPENDLGPVEGSLQLENLSLTFKLTASQQADLTTLLAEQQDPSSIYYHQWLTPEQYADRFGLSPNDLRQVSAWLQSQGLQITQTARGRTWVSFSGTATQVQSAFHTEIHYYSVDGNTYFANASEPAVPAALADAVLSIRGLDNYRLKPRSVFGLVGVSSADPEPNAVRPYVTVGASSAGPGPNPPIRMADRGDPYVANGGLPPNFTSSVTGNTFLSPGDFATIYDLQNLYNVGIDGAGQSLAIMGQTDLYGGGSDITAFRSASGLPPNSPTVILNGPDPGLSSGDIDEASLDLEWSGAVATNATIIYVNSKDVVNSSLYYAIDQDIAPVLSISYGACEAEWGSANLNTLAQFAQQASSQGQTIVASAGDTGAADCDYSSPTSVVTSATHGLAVDAPASVPNVTGMGGSEFNEGAGNYWTASTGGDVLSSALSYIPEMVWNDTASPENTDNGLQAGGGGVSTFFPKPTWQTGTGVPDDNARDVPDLSLSASALRDGYLVCIEGSCVNGYRSSNQTLFVAGGTSAATPTFAGMVALINQQMNTPQGQGNINPILYSLAQTSPAAFHDITIGNNMVPCTVTPTDTGCPASGEMGYSAGVGYDQASGLGSVDAYNLVMEWGSTASGNLPAPTLSAPANGAAGIALSPTFTWSQVSGNNGYLVMIAPSPTYLTTIPTVTTCAAPCIVVATSANSNSYTPPNALVAGAYYWQVQAIPTSSSAYGAWSGIFGFTTTGVSLPAPTLSAPGNGATAILLPPAFTWTTVSGSAGYRIMIATTLSALPVNPLVGTCGGGCLLDTTTTAAAYTPAATSLGAATTYYWEVQALAPSGSGQNGAWSSASSFTTAPADFSLSASPSSLTISPGNSGTSTITLNPINDFSAAVLYACTPSTALAGVTCTITLGANDSAVVTISAASSATTYPAFPRNPRFGGWWVAGAAMLALLLIALSKKKRLTTERTETTERSGYAYLGRVCGCLLVNPRLLSVSILRDLCGLCGEMLFGLWRVALGAALATLLLASLSCGGSSGSGGGVTTPPPESGTVTVTGASTTATHSVTISVSVS